jgi:hypothetical protein
MNIEIKGIVIATEEPKDFGAKGFRKSIIVVETNEEYKQCIPIEFVKDKADTAYKSMQIGDSVTVQADLRGREYGGKYYVGVSGWKWNVDASGGADAGEDEGVGF